MKFSERRSWNFIQRPVKLPDTRPYRPGPKFSFELVWDACIFKIAWFRRLFIFTVNNPSKEHSRSIINAAWGAGGVLINLLDLLWRVLACISERVWLAWKVRRERKAGPLCGGRERWRENGLCVEGRMMYVQEHTGDWSRRFAEYFFPPFWLHPYIPFTLSPCPDTLGDYLGLQCSMLHVWSVCRFRRISFQSNTAVTTTLHPFVLKCNAMGTGIIHCVL